MPNKLPPAHYRAKAIITAAAQAGAGIDFLPDAPTFRYYPNTDRPLEDRGPSARGAVSIPCEREGCLCKQRHAVWKKSKVPLDPAYTLPMAGDSQHLTAARKAYAKGDPQPLRSILSKGNPNG